MNGSSVLPGLPKTCSTPSLTSTSSMASIPRRMAGTLSSDSGHVSDAFSGRLLVQTKVQTRDKIFIDGAWVSSTGKGTLEVVNSTTEEVIGTIPEGTPADVDKAVAAAKRAFPGWSQTSVEERGKYLQRISEALGARTMDIANCIAQEVGMPINLSMMIQAGLPTV